MEDFGEYLKLIGMARDRIALESQFVGDYAFLEQAPLLEQIPVLEEKKIDPLQKQKKLEELQKEASSCTNCRLADGRTQVVFGSGPANARLVIVGEAPGFYEDKHGYPFVGKAGQLLTKMLAAIGLKREEVYICNVIKCRPPNNRDPEVDEIIACTHWLLEQLDLLSPKLLCGMGRFASSFLANTKQSMWKYRGNIYEYHSIPVICTYHPAYLLRNPQDKMKAWDDLKRIRSLLDESE